LFATRSTRVAKIFESILVAHARVSEAAGVGVPDSIKGDVKLRVAYDGMKREL
jgi:acyl-coenzyme A synthetase/AMP-(fatty) acid ligase